MLSAKKARQRPLIVSGGDRILSNIEKLWIFTIVKMRFGMFEVKYQPQIDQCSLGAHSVPEDGDNDRLFLDYVRLTSNIKSSPRIIQMCSSFCHFIDGLIVLFYGMLLITHQNSFAPDPLTDASILEVLLVSYILCYIYPLHLSH